METWEKVTTRSRVSIYRTNDPMEIIAAIGLKHDQDDRHTHIWRKKLTLCPVTVLVDSQVSDRCPWASSDDRRLMLHANKKNGCLIDKTIINCSNERPHLRHGFSGEIGRFL